MWAVVLAESNMSKFKPTTLQLPSYEVTHKQQQKDEYILWQLTVEDTNAFWNLSNCGWHGNAIPRTHFS